ncbi:DUF4625 domain-containing protein [Ascidiimonas aurantiaca]|uniref:DUF4625 domain-containing protein n=1 Tax=Ascidiimonas aurantiaca TaxID=1685432 RepID=UPI0030EF9E70
MRKHVVIPLCSLFLFSSCLNEDGDDLTDLAAPAISASDGQSNVQPTFFFKTSIDDPEIPLAFTITDATGIREIKIESHSGFDGHTHGRSMFARNLKFKLFNHNQVIGEEEIGNSNQFTYTSNIYLDDRNPEIASDELILAGPYHFSIQATDIEGNETNYRDNSTYHTTLYINKPYAPQVELTEVNTSENTISGRIYKNTSHEASSDITFLWIYIEEPNERTPNQEGTIIEEWIWGNSNWPHQFRPNKGQDLPNTQEIEIEQLLSGNSDFFNALQGNKLVFWIEDTNGNITVNQFNN